MKAVILAGGFGTRISEESYVRPKPMINIGSKPILWHIMKIYAAHGINDFVICCGYKGDIIKQYFANYHLHTADVTYDLGSRETVIHRCDSEEWRVTCVDTGANTLTGGRLKRVEKYLEGETFCLTYGDGVSNINITDCIKHHRASGKIATLSAVQAPGRYGAFTLRSGSSTVESFREKPKDDGAWINGGFFVLEPAVFGFIAGDLTAWEDEPMEILSRQGQLGAWRHTGFWQSMDTLRDKVYLEELLAKGKEPWNIWDYS